MKKVTLLLGVALLWGVCAYGVESSKPETHNTSWVRLHGNAAKANDTDCFVCHDERVECIGCHEDMAPRNHSIAWVQKNHGLESRWNRTQCAVCHKEDFCSECHESAVPISHSRSGFGGPAGSPGFHCQTSCQLPYGTWKNTPAKNCIVCHSTRPILNTGALHQMN